jgi:predicted transcriptional regulator
MLRLYEKKYSDKDIAAELNIPFSRVRRWRTVVAQLPPNEKKKVSYLLVYQVKKLIEERKGISDIAELLNVSDAIVSRAKYGKNLIGEIEQSNTKGMNDSQIAEQLGCTRQFIAEQRKQIALMSVKRRNITKRLSSITDLHSQQFISKEIATAVKSDVAHVNRDLKRLGLKPNKRDGAPRGHSDRVLVMMERIRELNAQGLNDPAIAQELKVKVPYVIRLRNEMGILSIRGKNSEKVA